MPSLEAALALAQIESPTDSMPRLEAALALAQRHESQTDIAFCLWRLALAAMHSNDLQGAATYFEQSIVYYRLLNDRFYLAYAAQRIRRTLFYIRPTRQGRCFGHAKSRFATPDR